jgi:hypothetical protein
MVEDVEDHHLRPVVDLLACDQRCRRPQAHGFVEQAAQILPGIRHGEGQGAVGVRAERVAHREDPVRDLLRDARPIRVRCIGYTRDQAVRVWIGKVLVNLPVELVVVVAGLQPGDAIRLAHELLEQIGQVLIAARRVAEDHPQGDVVEELLPLLPAQAVADPQPSDLVAHDVHDARRLALGIQHRFVELAPVPPRLAARQRQRVRLEVVHSLLLRARVRRVVGRGVVEHLPDRGLAPQHGQLAPQQANAFSAVLGPDRVQHLDRAPVGVQPRQPLHRARARREQATGQRRQQPGGDEAQAVRDGSFGQPARLARRLLRIHAP